MYGLYALFVTLPPYNFESPANHITIERVTQNIYFGMNFRIM